MNSARLGRPVVCSNAKIRASLFRPATLAMGASLLLLFFLTACSSESNKPAETAKPEVKGPELLTARSGFQKVYVAARSWNQDARPYRLESVVTSDGNGHDGNGSGHGNGED